MAKVSGGGTAGKALQKRAAELAKLPHLRVGFLEGSVNSQGVSIPMIAAIQEFGAPRARIPPRPFFRTMIAAHKSEWGPEFAALMKSMRPNVFKRVFSGLSGWSEEKDAIKALNLMGQRIAEQLQDSIKAMNAPALSEITLMLRWMRWKNPALKVTGKTVGQAAARVAAGKSSAGVSIKPLIDRGDMLKSVAFEVIKK